uniref:Hypocretin neuropeptide precursor n=1 Tax=Denticeps clupeoides TaxID=299321 RepID=A0AAY4CWN7_9TELE
AVLVPQRLHVLLVLLLLARLPCDAGDTGGCCWRDSRTCSLRELLCRSGKGGGFLGSAAGILTLGKRRARSRLQQILQASRNPAAGILTMGRRGATSWPPGVKSEEQRAE